MKVSACMGQNWKNADEIEKQMGTKFATPAFKLPKTVFNSTVKPVSLAATNYDEQ
jgi:hypothetical protein